MMPKELQGGNRDSSNTNGVTVITISNRLIGNIKDLK